MSRAPSRRTARRREALLPGHSVSSRGELNCECREQSSDRGRFAPLPTFGFALLGKVFWEKDAGESPGRIA
jgi:hypothetical protein